MTDDFAQLNLIGKSPSFLAALGLIGRFATSDATVLIEGETGTGKELAARAVHYLSARRDLPFIAVNCGALPDNLIESELFGHVRGAFTDARESRAGLVAQANGGTLFLDEVEAMSSRAQAVLLRFLQGKEYRPLGANLNKEADVRVVASSNANLKQLVQRGLFRSDLLFRLNALSLHLPLLSKRPGDIPILAEAFLDRLNRRSDQPPKVLHPDSLIVLEGYAWPGNVRELENLLHREFLLAPGPMIRIVCIDPDRLTAPPPHVDLHGAGEAFKVARARVIAQFEKAYLTALLSRTAGNLSLASRLSGKDRSDIGRLVRKYELDRHQFAAHRR